MNLKNMYYKLNSEEFKRELETIKNSANILKFFDDSNTPYFYCGSSALNEKILMLNKKQWEFDQLFNSFSDFGKQQLIQSFLIDEIESTNNIENIYSTRHDIFYLLNNPAITKNAKIKTIVKTYSLLLKEGPQAVETKAQLRSLYDCIFADILKKKDMPDGEYFRKEHVQISNDLKSAHQGFYPETIINQTMEEFLIMYNGAKETYLKNIICHFMLETIHPFYDGNGRLGRFLFTNSLFKETRSYFSLLISKTFSINKKDYYKAFKEGRELHQFGCIDCYVEMILDILLKGIDTEIKDLQFYRDNLILKPDMQMTKGEQMVYRLLGESTVLSDYGVSNNELIRYSGLCRRSVVKAVNSFREQDLLNDTTIGKTTYHKLKQ